MSGNSDDDKAKEGTSAARTSGPVTTIEGTNQSDNLNGTSGDDVMYGGNSNDTLHGGLGDDTLYGGNNSDLLYGAQGNDDLYGGDADDTIFGGSGDDYIDGGNGRNLMYGGLGNDTILGGNANDTVYGGSGDDLIYGGNSSDSLYGGMGSDTIYGGNANDTVYGGSGDDFLYGGGSSDRLYGGQGNDYIDGGEGDDTIEGGSGDDTLYGGLHQDRVYGGAGNDYLHDGDTADQRSPDSLYGGSGDDTLSGNGNQDRLYGGQGSDTFIVRAEDGNFNNIYIYGGDHDPNEWDVLDISEFVTRYPGLQIIYEQGGPTTKSGRMLLKTANGNELGRIHYSGIEQIRMEPAAICFTPGTLIATIRGEVPVEELRVGDRVITRDNGIRPLRWIGRRLLRANDLRAAPKLQPVVIKAGSLGHGLPMKDLVVSPNHRMLVRSEHSELLYEESEVLVAAKHLTGMAGITQQAYGRVRYYHLMFDQHEIILANGAWTESFQPGEFGMGSLDIEQRDELFTLFPELARASTLRDFPAARRSLRRHEVQVLRHEVGEAFLNPQRRRANAPRLPAYQDR